MVFVNEAVCRGGTTSNPKTLKYHRSTVKGRKSFYSRIGSFSTSERNVSAHFEDYPGTSGKDMGPSRLDKSLRRGSCGGSSDSGALKVGGGDACGIPGKNDRSGIPKQYFAKNFPQTVQSDRVRISSNFALLNSTHEGKSSEHHSSESMIESSESKTAAKKTIHLMRYFIEPSKTPY